METRKRVGFFTILAILCSVITIALSAEDVKCIERPINIPGRSLVCVCNANQCDTITRENPPPQTYVMYTSTNAGKRFEKTSGPILTSSTLQQTIVETADTDNNEEQEPSLSDVLKDYEADDILEQYQPETFGDDENAELAAGVSEFGLFKNFGSFTRDLPIDMNAEDVDLEGVLIKYRHLFRNRRKREEDLEATLLNDAGVRSVTLTIATNDRRQFIQGFGGSVTDAASINWKLLSEATQQKLIESYFGPTGLEYNMIRVPIAGSDFSEYPYTYNEFPWNDAALSNFSLTDQDYSFKLPMIKKAQEVATDEIKITASTWSPPIWMKTNERITGFGQLKPEFFQTYADYHIRFLEEYEKAGVDIWALTTTNEPLNGIIPLARFNSLGFAPWQMAKYVGENLGPTIKNSRFNKTLILGVDDQRYMLPIYLRGMRQEDPKSLDYLDGIAVHYYGNFIPGLILSLIQRQFPDKILLSTEACEGAMPWDLEKVELGSWRRARRYVTSIMEDLNNFVVGWIDWNLCLSPTGGPNWANNFVDSPILVYGPQDEFVKQPMFYAMGHFSKFIPRGSQVVSVNRSGDQMIETVAVVKPDNNIVMVIQNRRSAPLNMRVVISSNQFIDFEMEPESLKTIEFNP